MSVQTKIAELERQVAKKKALVNAKISLPKDTPEDVKAEVNAAIQEALLKLAENDSLGESEETFSKEEITVLKLLASRALTKPAATSKATVNTTNMVESAPKEMGEKVLGKIDTAATGDYVGREAELMSLDAVPVRQRGKVRSMERCKVMEQRPDGLLHILTVSGVRFNVNAEDLNFDLAESN